MPDVETCESCGSEINPTDRRYGRGGGVLCVKCVENSVRAVRTVAVCQRLVLLMLLCVIWGIGVFWRPWKIGFFSEDMYYYSLLVVDICVAFVGVKSLRALGTSLTIKFLYVIAVFLVGIGPLCVFLVAVARLLRGTGEGIGDIILYLIVLFVPVAGVFGIIMINMSANKFLRRAGLKVGLLGVGEVELERYVPYASIDVPEERPTDEAKRPQEESAQRHEETTSDVSQKAVDKRPKRSLIRWVIFILLVVVIVIVSAVSLSLLLLFISGS